MHKWKYICVFFVSICIAFIRTNPTEDYPDSDDSVTTTDVLKETEGVPEREEENIIIEDENKVLRIYLVGGAELRTALRNEEKIWKNGTIPYEIDDGFKKENRDFIFNAIEEFHNKTCVRFKPRKDEKSYIFIVPGSGCSAGVGRGPQANQVKLHEACFVKGIVIHELMHTLGFVHEQNRPDRDKFVRIEFDNVKEGSVKNFNKYSENRVNTFNQSYDYESVMHYGAFDFAKNKRKPTIIPLKEGVKIGQRVGFSEKDLIKINLLYNCADRSSTGSDNKEKKNEKSKRFRLFHLLSRLF